jgi:hypothetical protein
MRTVSLKALTFLLVVIAPGSNSRAAADVPRMILLPATNANDLFQQANEMGEYGNLTFAFQSEGCSFVMKPNGLGRKECSLLSTKRPAKYSGDNGSTWSVDAEKLEHRTKRVLFAPTNGVGYDAYLLINPQSKFYENSTC